MASSSSRNKDISLSTLLSWYKIRDTFVGQNNVFQNIPLAIEHAAACDHPDARWLTEACVGKDVRTVEDARRVFSAFGQDDARALCFAWLCCLKTDLSPLRRSSDLCFAFSQVLMAQQSWGAERLKFARLAALQGERDGFYWLAICFRDGEGCEMDLIKAKENFLLSSELGHVWSMIDLAVLLDESDTQRWHWWGRAAAIGAAGCFVEQFAEQVERFRSGYGSAPVVFAIGRALRGCIDEDNSFLFNTWVVDSLLETAIFAVGFYEAQVKATIDAMRVWTLVGIKLNVVKDVRKLIAKLIWDSREEALYDVSAQYEHKEQEEQEPQPSARALRAQKRALK
jgi:hypothetical protein